MGITELFHFRRLLRRGRRVADGSRQFVIGLDQTASGANSATSSSATGVFPKGSHFIVAFNRDVQLTEHEMDVCNNNDIGANNHGRSLVRLEAANSGFRIMPSSSSTISGVSLSRDSMILNTVPGTSFINGSSGGGPQTREAHLQTVIPTTELKEASFLR